MEACSWGRAVARSSQSCKDWKETDHQPTAEEQNNMMSSSEIANDCKQHKTFSIALL